MLPFAQLIDYEFVKNNFTLLFLSEMYSLTGRYAKLMYYYFRKYRDMGVWKIPVSEFKAVLGFKEEIRNNAICATVQPLLKELSEFFPNLQFYKQTGEKNRIEQFMFTFDPMPTENTDIRSRHRMLAHIRADGNWVRYPGLPKPVWDDDEIECIKEELEKIENNDLYYLHPEIKTPFDEPYGF